MKQIFIVGHGGPEKLQLRESPDPSPGAGEIRIRVKASRINFADILARRGLYPDSPKIPCVVGYEVSGTVDETGPGVNQCWLGKDVFALMRFRGYSDVVVVPEKQAFEKPASVSHAQAAAIPVNYLTAWQLLVVMGSLNPGETVLIHDAGGGVGLAAIAVARHIRATVYGTASSGKHAFLRQRGLHEAIDYRTKDWTLELNRLTKGKGVALITVRSAAITGRRATGPCVRRDGSACLVFRWQRRRSCSERCVCCRLRSAAALPPALADQQKQIRLRREPRPHVARGRHDRWLDANTADGRRGWLGSPPRGQDLPAS